MTRQIKKITGWSATLTLFALMVGCSSLSRSQNPSQPTSPSSQGSSNTSSQEPRLKPSVPPLSKSIHPVGEVVSINDKNVNVQFSVNGIREHKGKGVIRPNQGHKWIVVDMTIANQGPNPSTLSVISFELIDSKNNQYEVALLAEALDDVKSPTGQLNPGDKRRGEVGFEVPEKAKELKLVFKPNSSNCEAPASESNQSVVLNCQRVVVKLN